MQWYQQSCGAKPPMADEKWEDCTRVILEGALALLKKIQLFIAQLKTMPNSELLVRDLGRAAANQVSPYAFDEVVEATAKDLGRTRIDYVKFRAEHLSNWISALDKLPEGYDFLREARLLVERSFLDNPEKPPVSGLDIIQELKVPPGKEVGRLLAIAHRLFEEGITDKQTILDRLRGL
jgi:hypothetical protein